MNKKLKNKIIQIRCTETLLRKLLSICVVTGRTKTAVIEELICTEYEKNKKYETQYYTDLEKNV